VEFPVQDSDALTHTNDSKPQRHKANVALTRFTKEVERPGQEKPEVTHWAATTVFKYSGAPMKEKDRRVNPLGYQSCEYRLDSDAASGEARPAAAPIPALQDAPPAANIGVVLFPGIGASQATEAQVPAIQANQGSGVQ
jgi:hypothetical protein